MFLCANCCVDDVHVCSNWNKLMGISVPSFYIGRPKRSVKMKEISSAYEYTPESVPPEWDRTFIKITVPIVIIFMHSVHFCILFCVHRVAERSSQEPTH